MQPRKDTEQLPTYDQPGIQYAPTEQFPPAGGVTGSGASGHGTGTGGSGRGNDNGNDNGGTAGASRGGRNTGRWVGIGVIVLVVLLIAGAVGLEFGTRKAITDNLREEITASLGSVPEVDLGSAPVLMTTFTGTIGQVRITTDGTPAAGATGPVPAIDITAENIRQDGDVSRIGSLRGTAFVSDEAMSAAAQEDSSGGLLGGFIQVQGIVSDPASGTLRVTIGGLAEAVVTPRLVNGDLEMDPQQASILGFPLPRELLGGTVSMMNSTLAELPEGVELTGVRVVPGGMVVELAGTDVVLESTN